jgi:CheY-like chemotaxis protein
MRTRILVVDDDRDNADSLARLIDILGYEAITAYSGAEAIQIVQQHCPEMALIDISMPGMDGYETAAQIRQLASSSTILVAVTGWTRKEDQQQAVNAGFDLHYTKPLRVDSLEGLLGICSHSAASQA